tara:strand:+ start:267 stop:497 length:231 start_codon:yes stop_codon:yes gene_type:complete
MRSGCKTVSRAGRARRKDFKAYSNVAVSSTTGFIIASEGWWRHAARSIELKYPLLEVELYIHVVRQFFLKIVSQVS